MAGRLQALGGFSPAPAAMPTTANAPAGAAKAEAESLDKNVRGLNEANQLRQIERLKERHGGEKGKGVQVKEAY